MPLEERKKRHAALLNNVKTENLSWWRENYLTALSSVPPSSAQGDQRAVTEETSVTITKRKRDDGASSWQAVEIRRNPMIAAWLIVISDVNPVHS
jgi:hypothetical protein